MAEQPAPRPSFRPGDLMRVTHAASILDTSTQSVYRLIANGHLRAVRVGHSWRVVKASLNRLIGDQDQQEDRP